MLETRDILIIAAIFGGALGIMIAAILWARKKKSAWKNFASQTGLTYRDRGLYSLPSASGEYRNHPVAIWVGAEQSGESTTHYTECRVGLRNPQAIVMYLYEESLLFKIGKRIGVRGQDIQVGYPEFDKKFRIKGNRESDIRAILEPCICNEIMHILEPPLWSKIPSIPSITSIWSKRMNIRGSSIVIDEQDPNQARYFTYGWASDPRKLVRILDTLIDFVERLEKT